MQSSWKQFQFTSLHERQRFHRKVTRAIYGIFQFTSLHERQLPDVQSNQEALTISIHASAWEATRIFLKRENGVIFQFTPLHERQLWRQGKKELAVLHFNSRLCMRGNGKMETENRYIEFQFTPLHKRRRASRVIRLLRYIFQFTPLHERRRCSINLHRQSTAISIHAST